MQLISPKNWKAYALIDSGNGEKLERFGEITLRRPEPQALWGKSMTEAEWQEKADARFVQKSSASGDWEKKQSLPDHWEIAYELQGIPLHFKLAFTRFKHVGIFPEQAVNWEFIYDACKAIPKAKVLNLFAYTGGASLAARAAGADVTHCDSIKQVVNWANQNMQLSKMDDIRWLVEDALKFVKREAKRGNLYNGIMLDPPSWGHGPKGEKWKLEDHINELMEHVSKIMMPKKRFLVFNAYSLGYSPIILQNLIHSHLGTSVAEKTALGELFLEEESGRKLPAGIFARFLEK